MMNSQSTLSKNSQKSEISTWLPSLEAIDRELAERSLHQFICQAWPIIEPATPFIDNWHIGAICEYLEAVTRGEITRLLINIPPRSMKSTSVTVMWPCWEWTKRPGLRYLCASFSESLALTHSLNRRAIIESKWYQANWGDRVRLATAQNEKAEFQNTARGAMVATHTSGGHGKGGNRVIVDDPHNPEQALSDAERERGLRGFRLTLSTRLNDKSKDAIVVVMQRLHEEDVSGFCIDQGYEHLCLPSEYEPDHPYVWARDPRKEAGQLLFPDREGPAAIAEAKINLGQYGYSGQHQQRPSPAAGVKFKRSDFRYFTIDETGEFFQLGQPDGSVRAHRRTDCWTFQTVDAAASERESSDYFVCSTWAVTPRRDLLLVNVFREKAETTRHDEILLSLFARFEPAQIGVENATYGLAIVQRLLVRGLPVIGLPAKGDKMARSLAIQTRYNAGTVYHLKDADWLDIYEDELLKFPRAVHDDCVDTASYAGIMLAGFSDWEAPPDPNQINEVTPDTRVDPDLEERMRQFYAERAEQDEDYEW